LRNPDRREFLRRIGVGGLAAAATLTPFGRIATSQVRRDLDRWPEAAARDWGGRQLWLIGANYVPASAVNSLEMWQAETFDPDRIDTEFGWAADLGMNAMRVFLHDLLWLQDPSGFLARIEAYLAIAEKHGVRTQFVLFDSCWDPFPHLGPQGPPTPGVHNSRWVQAPGIRALGDPGQRPRLEAYVTGVVGALRDDPRVLSWDVWNEPDNPNIVAYRSPEPPNEEHVLALLPYAFDWVRKADPVQPLTSAPWIGDWSTDAELTPIGRIQFAQSDIISFHNYSPPAEFEARIQQLRRFDRPLLCTEYLARPLGNTIESILPIAKREGVGMFNWGLVAGRSQTFLPWDSWESPYVGIEPPLWLHDIFYADGRPYRPAEAQLIRDLTGRNRQ
jgi:hypothetical protein